MSPGIKEANDLSLPKAYKVSLEQHIEKGGCSLVCRDEDLCKRVEEILQRGQSAEESHLRLNLDVLSVMEESLCSPTTVMAGLQGLARAFEVLELASLNLYLYPWRKEYRVIKTYSGIFTHQVKPALSAVQVEELFGLLGYQVSLGSSGEEELRLGPSTTLPDDLVRLACCFFVGRSECQLLLSALEPLCPPSTSTPTQRAAGPQGSAAWRAAAQVSAGRQGTQRSEWERRLVQERRSGHSLQVAIQRVRRSLVATSSSCSSSAAVYPSMEACCHTEEEEEEEEATGGACGPEGEVMPLQVPNNQLQQQQSPLQHTHSSSSSSSSLPLSSGVLTTATSPSPTSPRCVSTLSYRLSSPSSPGGGARLMEEPTFQVPGSGLLPVVAAAVECGCAKYSSCNYLCHQCNIMHCISCPVLAGCQDTDHMVTYVSRNAQFLEPAANELRRVSNQPIASPVKRHVCLKARDEPHLTCHTCNHAHDYLCEDGQCCTRDGHQVEYRLQQNRSMPFHSCCGAASSAPQFACLSCRLFHTASCPDGDACRLRHSVQELRGACKFECEGCSSPPHILCRHCCAQVCRECWYKSPLNCPCGTPYECGSSV